MSIPDGTARPLHCCAECAVDCEPVELPAPIPAQREIRTRPAIAACIGCLEMVGPQDSQVRDALGTWHTRCLNASREEYATWMAEQDEAADITVTPKPMGAAIAPRTERTEVA